jgi:dTMP kinase
MKKSGLKSLFITFEGTEGSGKSTQARTLYRRLHRLSISSVLVHEPGSTQLGERLSRLLKRGSTGSISATSELLLFNAARAQLVAQVVVPSLKSGACVLCDRYTDSTIAYQGYGRGLQLQMVRAANDIATNGLNPHITILLDLPVRDGLARKKDIHIDRFESEDIAFHERVRRGYLTLAREEKDRFLVIDGRQSKQTISEAIWQRVRSLFGQ